MCFCSHDWANQQAGFPPKSTAQLSAAARPILRGRPNKTQTDRVKQPLMQPPDVRQHFPPQAAAACRADRPRPVHLILSITQSLSSLQLSIPPEGKPSTPVPTPPRNRFGRRRLQLPILVLDSAPLRTIICMKHDSVVETPLFDLDLTRPILPH